MYQCKRKFEEVQMFLISLQGDLDRPFSIFCIQNFSFVGFFAPSEIVSGVGSKVL